MLTQESQTSTSALREEARRLLSLARLGGQMKANALSRVTEAAQTNAYWDALVRRLETTVTTGDRSKLIDAIRQFQGYERQPRV